MRTVYAIQFTISPASDSTAEEVWAELESRIRTWIEGKYRYAWDTDFALDLSESQSAPLPRHSIRCRALRMNGRRLLDLAWSHPDENDDSLSWHVDVSLVTEGEKIEASFAVRIRSERFVIKPAGSYEVGRPRIVSDLLTSYPCQVDGSPVPTRTTSVDKQGIQGLVDHLVDPRRSFPVVAVTPENNSNQPLVDPEALQSNLLGYAHVVTFATSSLTYRLTHAIGKDLSCYDGAVRLYWPGFDRTADKYDHPLYTPARLRHYAARGRTIGDHLFSLLRRIAALRHSSTEAASQIRRAEENRREKEVEQLREQIDERTLNEAELLAELEKALDEADRLRRDLEQAQERQRELQAEVEAYKANLAAVYQHEEEEELAEERGDTAPDQFDSVLEALVEAGGLYEDKLEIWDPALESAEESEFARPREVFDVLSAIAQLGEAYFQAEATGESIGPWGDWLEERGITQYAPQESESTMNRYGEDRVFTHDGEQTEIQRHVTLGGGDRVNCLQIFFDPDRDQEKMVIAYCGMHLPFTSHRT